MQPTMQPIDLTISPQTVQSQVVSKLRDAILSGHFQPGERLVESALCEMANVSRSSIREALRRLEAEKLIVIVPNKGPSVAKITWEEAEDIYQVRALLEGGAAYLFATRVTDEDIKKMRAALRNFERAVKENDAVARLHTTTEFYAVMLGGCGNRVIREVIEGLLARINLLRFHSMSQSGRSRFSSRELRRILQAFEKKDPEAARLATVEHIKAAEATARLVFAQNGEL